MPSDPSMELAVAFESTTDRLSRPELQRRLLTRRLTYMMLVRVVLFTLILGGTVGVNLAWGTPEELGGPHVRMLFIFITVIYLVNIGYAVAMRLGARLLPLAVVQLVVDLLTAAVLVHFTGGAESAFALLFMLTPIAAAVSIGRRAAILASLVSVSTFLLVAFLGHVGVLPPFPGQVRLPSDISPGALGRSLLVNGSAIIAIAVLAGYLAEQLRSAAAQMELQQAHIDDLATLNVDIIRCLTSGLVTINEHGRVLSINRAAREILALPSGQMAGRLLQEISPELDSAVSCPASNRRAELPLRREGREQLLGISVSPLTDHLNETRGRIINFQDLTAIREMERAMRRSEHLASLGRMAAGIAHEIRNPLASISGSLQLLGSESGMSQDNRRLMEIALREVERLDQLITSFLDYARPKTPATQPLDLGVEIGQLLEGMATAEPGEATPEVVVEQCEVGLWVEADRKQLRAILWNLVRNAEEAGEQQRIEVCVFADGDRAVLQVRDHGEGIPPDVQEKLFEPFFTTKEQGTGLGLATVYRMVQDHHGEITARSDDAGTTVSIALPLIPPPN